MTQGDLFRDEGIKQVEDNADPEWMAEALVSACQMACSKEYFTTDNVWHLMRDMEEPHDNRAMGAVMRKAQAEGWIEPTDRVVKSTRPVCHSRPIRVWKSKLI